MTLFQLYLSFDLIKSCDHSSLIQPPIVSYLPILLIFLHHNRFSIAIWQLLAHTMSTLSLASSNHIRIHYTSNKLLLRLFCPCMSPVSWRLCTQADCWSWLEVEDLLNNLIRPHASVVQLLWGLFHVYVANCNGLQATGNHYLLTLKVVSSAGGGIVGKVLLISPVTKVRLGENPMIVWKMGERWMLGPMRGIRDCCNMF